MSSSTDQAKKIVCSSCNQVAHTLFDCKDYNKKISKEIFSYYRCENCGFIFLANVPKDLGKYYPREYYAIPEDLQDLAKLSINEQYKIDILTTVATKGKLLEIGPAFGNFAFLAKQQGFEVEGLEMSHECCAFLRNTLGIKVTETSDIISGIQTSGQYDVIVLWHVFEHLVAPWSALKTLSKHLNPGGTLLLAMPNPKSLQYRLFGRYWAHLDAPRHVCLISPELMTAKAHDAGLQRSQLTFTDRGSLGWNAFGWQVTLMNTFNNRVLKFLMKVLGKALSIALAPLEKRGENGSCYTIIFRKTP